MQFTNELEWLRATQPYYRNQYAPYVGPRYRYKALSPPIVNSGISPQEDRPYAPVSPLCGALLDEVDLTKSYLDRNIDPVVGLLSRRHQLEKARIEVVTDDLRRRYDIMDTNLKTLDYQICAVHSEIMQLPEMELGINKDLDRTRTSLEAKAMDLEQEKMREEQTGWKEMHALKVELLESLQRYATTGMSSNMLSDEEGGKDR